ncbi:hypothetical protein KSB_64110 [Ktedonobacter robiniae]|uniref:Carrier domain-containing protein n=1 Tax=Ktedonobacter robiniae TaxID=2778365 RepID=A0ABQ3UYH9_9CHLR|nr:hypothetical protein KSB_64110 [Ktedonobacter robiniae]
MPIGVVGEIYLGGAGVARGYLGRASLTAERFVPDAWSGEVGGRVYRTGDLGRYREDGSLEYVGRVDQQVKVRGYRIELGEIETVLAQHPCVSECIILVEDGLLIAYVVVEQMEEAEAEIRAYLSEKLPGYMVPGRFVWLPALPRTANGKIDRVALVQVEIEEEVKVVEGAPSGVIEEVMVEIWASVLKRKRIGRQESFFELGGHSLLATQVMARVRSVFGVEVGVGALFEAPTIEGLAIRVREALEGANPGERPSLVVVERKQDLPLSFTQQRLWLLDQIEPGSAAYNIPTATRLHGPLNKAVLEKSLREVVRRHEALRTTFKEKNGQAVQVINAWEDFAIQYEDWRDLSHEEQESRVQQAILAEDSTPFDLARGPLLRVSLLCLHTHEHVLLLTMHHIIADGWSMGLLQREITTLYMAFQKGQPSPLSELTLQYADYAAWQRSWLQGEVLERHLAYWKRQLQDLSPLDLPTDYPRPPRQTFNGALQTLLLPTALVEELRQISQREDATLFMLLLAAFQVLLARYSGQEDIAVGTPIANRTHTEIEKLIGSFINTLVLRTDLAGNPSFCELIARVREVCLGAYAHQEVPFERLVEELQPERDLSRSPLFQVMLVLQNLPVVNNTFVGLTTSSFEREHAAAKYELSLTMTELEQGLFCELAYNTDLFSEQTINRLLGHWQRLLSGIAAQPDAHLEDLPLLTETERQQILAINATEQAYPRECCLPQLFEAQVERTPQAIAVICGGERFTYQELNAQANRLAWELTARGVGPEVPIALYAERGPLFLISVLAVWKAGGIHVPIDPNYPAVRVAQILDQSACALVLTNRHLQAQLESALPATRVAEEGLLALAAIEMLLEQGTNITNLPAHCEPHNLAYIIYTSGSTGAPKGVMVEHGGMLNHIYGKISDLQITQEDCVIQNGPPCFDIIIWQCFASLLVGGRVQILRDEIAFDPSRLLEQTEQSHASILQIVPSMLREIIYEAERRGQQRPSLTTLRWIVPTGDALPTELCQRWLESYPAIPLLNTYGSTECSDDQCHYAIQQLTFEPELVPIAPVGYPISNMQAYVLDHALSLVPPGVIGELYIGGVGVGRGYLRDPGRTATVFLPDPFSTIPGGRLYKTGDQARYLAEGAIEFLGRVDHLVKIRGHRIEVGEIEAVLAQHPGVLESVVVVHTDAQHEKSLVAYVVSDSQHVLDSQEVRTYLQGKLPEVMHPTHIMALDALPLTPLGKVDRKALSQIEIIGRDVTAQSEEPRNPVEETIAEIWQDLLHCQTISIYDNFFHLGGHSLLATQVMARIRTMLGVELPLRSLFETPTLAGLARQVTQRLHKSQVQFSLPALRATQMLEAPLSFAQQRLWFLDQLEPANPAYTLPLAARLHGSLDMKVLVKSLYEIVLRHQTLRTTFPLKNGDPVQLVHPVDDFRVQFINGSSWSNTEQEVRTSQILQAEILRPFNLQEELPFRVTILRLSSEEHILLVNMHHIISDAWSIGILVRELAACYSAFEQKKTSPLPELPVQYVDYAHWQQTWLRGEPLQHQLDYWKNQLSGLEPLALPTDYPRPAVQTFHGARLTVRSKPELLEKLKQVCHQEGTTLFMTLLAAFQALLAHYSGQNDIAVGIPVANRTQEELEPLIGFFVNTLVLRIDLSGNPTLRELLQRVRKVALDAYAHQDAPFEQLVEALHPERDLSRSPLFQAMFVLQNAPATGTTFSEHLSLEPLVSENLTAKFDLTFSLTESQQGLQCVAEYNTDLFAEASIQRLLGHWQRLLAALVEQPDQPFRSLPLLEEAQSQQLLRDWNATTLPLEGIALVPQRIVHQARQTPHHLALTDGQHQLTYAQLDRRSAWIATQLRAAGVRAGDRVGICLPRSVDLVVGMLAILRLGAAYVPLDPDYPQERLHYMVTQSGMRVVLSMVTPKLPTTWGAEVAMVLLEAGELDTEQMGELDAALEEISSESVAYVIYTSGSTGQPKGVAIGQGALRNSLFSLQQRLGLGEQDRLLAVTSISFDIAGLELLQPLTCGAQIWIASRREASEAEALQQVLQRSEATVMQATPATWRLLVEAGWQGKDRMTILCGGEALPRGLARALKGKGRAVWNLYGPTETTIWSTCERIEGEEERIRIGTPIGNTQVYVLDEAGRVVPQGVIGELYIGGASVGEGYWGDARQTAERFVPDPFGSEAGKRLYRTGDEVRWAENGKLEYIGRKDQQVKVRGYRIELGEIEGALEEQEEVEGGVVVVQEGELVGYVVGRGGKMIEEQALRSRLRQHLPGYMVPQRIEVVPAFPLTPNGKVDRLALAEFTQQSEVYGENIEQPAKLTSPVESILLGIWEDVLRRKGIQTYDNFFELGGHSLLATQVVTRLRRIFTPNIPVSVLFETPNIAELARRIEHDQYGAQAVPEGPVLVPVPREQALLLSFAQQRLWFQDRLDPGNPAYNIPLAMHVQGVLKFDALEQTLREIVRRHEILRTTYRFDGEQVVQVIGSADDFCLEQHVLHVEDSTLKQHLTQKFMRAEAEHRFDLAHGPLFRAALVQFDQEQEYLLLVTMHHIVADAWSLQLFRHELVTLYAAFAQSQPSPLPALPIQYADFAQWQRRSFQNRTFEAHLDYWTTQLRGARAFDLPADHSRKSGTSNRGASYTFRLPDDLSQALLAYSKREEVTLFMTLLAAFQVLLARLTGSKDIVVGTDIASRTQVETESLIGFFVNLLALRLQLDGQPLFREVLQQVRTMVLDAYVHQDLPFDYLVDQLHLERRDGMTPLINVLFVLQNVPEMPTETRMPELVVKLVGDTATQHAKFDAAFFLVEGPAGLRGMVNYNTNLFEERTIAQLVQRYEALLQNILAHPEDPIHVLGIAPGSDKMSLDTRRDSLRSRLRTVKEESIDLD